MPTRDALHEIEAAALALGYAELREALLSEVPSDLLEHLPRVATPAAQLRSDVERLDELGVLDAWLRVARTLAAGKAERAVFDAALARGSAPRAEPTVVILTALGLEYQAVREHLHDCVEEVLDSGTIVEVGAFTAAGRRLSVALAETGQGNSPAAGIAQEVISRFDPRLIVFVGVAGGLKDVRLGDVVAATKIYGYESGKAEAGFMPRPDVGQSSHRLVQRAKAEARGTSWLARLGASRSADPPRAFVGPIAAGSAVVASTSAPLFAFLRTQYGDALAVEMEGRGFLETTGRNRTEALVVRGISDVIDRKAEADASGSQQIAARNAAAFALEVIAKVR